MVSVRRNLYVNVTLSEQSTTLPVLNNPQVEAVWKGSKEQFIFYLSTKASVTLCVSKRLYTCANHARWPLANKG